MTLSETIIVKWRAQKVKLKPIVHECLQDSSCFYAFECQDFTAYIQEICSV